MERDGGQGADMFPAHAGIRSPPAATHGPSGQPSVQLPACKTWPLSPSPLPSVSSTFGARKPSPRR